MDHPYYPRELEDEILTQWDLKRFFVIEGPRRSGKTTLLKRLQQLKGGTYVTFENPKERVDFLNDPLNYLPSIGDGPYFLDEIQYTGEKGARALKLIFDETDHRVISSGSGAFGIKMKLKAYLVGRAYFKTLLPLSFSEFVRWKKPAIYDTYKKGRESLNMLLNGQTTTLPQVSERLNALFKQYAMFGGYPEVVLKGKEELMQIANTVVEEDVLHYFSRLDSLKVWGFVRRLAALSGKMLQYTSLNIRQQTAEHYISIFSYAHLIYLLTPYFTNPLKELVKTPKVFFYDNGVRNALINSFSPLDLRPDKGELVEMAVIRQMVGENLHYWRTKNKAEVDLVVVRENPIPVEVKSGRGKVTRSLLSFVAQYHPPAAVVVGNDVRVEKRDQTLIAVVPPYYF